jgi:hypothetical protein
MTVEWHDSDTVMLIRPQPLFSNMHQIFGYSLVQVCLLYRSLLNSGSTVTKQLKHHSIFTYDYIFLNSQIQEIHVRIHILRIQFTDTLATESIYSVKLNQYKF